MAHVISNKSQYGKISPTATGIWSSKIWYVISTPDLSLSPLPQDVFFENRIVSHIDIMVHLSLKVLVAQSNPTFCDPMDCRLLCPWNSPGKNTGVACHSLLQRIFLTQVLNPGLIHCRQILYCLSYQESQEGIMKAIKWSEYKLEMFNNRNAPCFLWK